MNKHHKFSLISVICCTLINIANSDTIGTLIQPQDVVLKTASDHIYDGVVCPNLENPRNNPPWDPCKLFPVNDVPENEEEGRAYVNSAMDRIKNIHEQPFSIDTLNQLGLLGQGADKAQNGAALELLMWEAGFTMPPQDFSGQYQYQNFYNGAYGNNFQYLILPFNYTPVYGIFWPRCQPLRFIPSTSEIQTAQKIMGAFEGFTSLLTQGYTPKDASEETPDQTYERQKAYLTQSLDALQSFDYDGYLAHARSELTKYLNTQTSATISGNYYINPDCKTQQYGKLTIYE